MGKITLEVTKVGAASIYLSSKGYEVEFDGKDTVLVKGITDQTLATVLSAIDLDQETLNIAKTAASQAIVQASDAARQKFLAGYSKAEVDGWTQKYNEAKLVAAAGVDNAMTALESTMLLKKLATSRKLDSAGLTDLANAIIQKADAMATFSTTLESIRAIADEGFAAATSAEEVSDSRDIALASITKMSVLT